MQKACKLDNDDDDVTHVLELGKLVQAWEQASKRLEVDTKRDAERLSANFPPQILQEELFLLKKQYAIRKHIPMKQMFGATTGRLRRQTSRSSTNRRR